MPFTLPDPWIPDASVQRNFDAIAQRLTLVENLPARVTSLAASPPDGQEVYYAADATNGVYWHLKYNAASASAYKWEFVGGAPLTSEDDSDVSTASASYVDLGSGPANTLPLAGDYIVSHGCGYFYNNGPAYAIAIVDVGGTDKLSTQIQDYGNNGAGVAPGATTRRLNGLTASNVVRQQYRTTSASWTALFGLRWLTVTPVRVG